jgi:hypothetical protein
MVPSSPLPTLHDVGDSQNYPEWIQLASGEHCAAPTGAVDSYRGQPIRFFCDHHLYVVGDLGGQGLLKTAAVVRADAQYNYTWVGIFQVATIWLPKRDTTEPTSPARGLDGTAIAAYITARTGDASVQCPARMPIEIGASYSCGGDQTAYKIRILNYGVEYSLTYG